MTSTAVPVQLVARVSSSPRRGELSFRYGRLLQSSDIPVPAACQCSDRASIHCSPLSSYTDFSTLIQNGNRFSRGNVVPIRNVIDRYDIQFNRDATKKNFFHLTIQKTFFLEFLFVVVSE